MVKGHLIFGLDVGTHSIKALVVLKKPQEKDLEIISQAEIKNIGMRKGVVINSNEVSEKIIEAVSICKQGLDRKIGSVITSINGSHLLFLPGKGLVSVSRADQKISEADIERAFQASRSGVSLSANQEILEVFPQEFIIDGQLGIKDVEGLRGIRLEVKTLCLVAFSLYLKNLSDSVLGADLEIEHILPSVIASSQSVLDQEEKESGVALIEIGAGTTSLAVFEEGNLVDAMVFPIGSNNITNDIAIILKTEIEEAENIKKSFTGFSLKESRKTISKIIEARTKEIFNEVNKELKRAGKTKLPAGIVLTGGGANLSKIVDFAKKELKLHCRLGLPKGFSPEINDPSWSTVCGLVLDGAKTFEGEDNLLFSGKGIFRKIKSIFQIFNP
ncbi:MAG: cell division protein FtsA [Parcubacteria group bacterium CG23_combo_of_CG06-09_8_20_14_all_35_6]|nr:MAG: cell division protein FtsA [Parcubacteria group bacterium CG23_combo_of_CG06-09_8_20_14_all_35_6]PIR58431.1 MAG: cell division protein FtsA [Parcubacteria group bacterium CG10_big_fil_rev_8_21_14_0_10_35_15]